MTVPALDEATRRLDEYRARGEPRLIMGEDIPELLHALLAEAERRSDAGTEPDAVAERCVAATASIIWYTAEHVPAEVRRQVQRDAAGLAAMVDPRYLTLLPPALSQLCAGQYGDGPIEWRDRAVALLEPSGQVDPVSLETAIVLLENAVAATPDLHPAHIGYLADLAHAQRMRFDESGVRADLDAAIATRRRALLALGSGDNEATHLCDLGLTLRQRFLRFDDRAALDEAIDVLGRAVDAAADDDPDRWRCLNNLANAQCDRYRITGDADALDRAIEAAREAVARIGPDDPFRGACLANLSGALQYRFDRDHRPAELDDLLSILTRKIDRTLQHDVVDITADDTMTVVSQLLERPHPQAMGSVITATAAWTTWLRYLTLPLGQAEPERELAVGLFAAIAETHAADVLPDAIREVLDSLTSPPGRGMSGGELGGLAKKIAFTLQRAESQQDAALVTEALGLGRRFLAATDDHPDLAQTLANMAGAYGLRVRLRIMADDPVESVVADLDLVIATARAALRQHGRPHDHHAARTNLASALTLHAERVDPDTNLDEAIEAYRNLSADPALAGLPALLDASSRLFGLRFARDGDPGDLDAAIEALNTLRPDGAEPLGRYATLLMARHALTGRPSDADEAYERAAQAIAQATEVPVALVVVLASAAGKRLVDDRDLTELDHAIGLLREAIARDHDADATMPLAALGDALRQRARFSHAATDADEALAAYELALTRSVDVLDRVRMLTGIGLTLADRAERTGAGDDLDRAIDSYRAALGELSADPPWRPTTLGNLCVALTDRGAGTGSRDDLDEAVNSAREALAMPAARSVREDWLWANLGAALDARFRNSGHLDDIDAAVDAHRAAATAAVADPGHHLSNLGAVLRIRSEYVGNINDLEEAVGVHRDAVAATPAGAPERARRLSRYGVAQYELARWTDSEQQLGGVVNIQREALAAAPADSPDRIRCLVSLASSLNALDRATGAASHRDEAVDLLRQALAFPGNDSHQLATIRLNLGATLTARADELGRPVDLDDACEELQRAVREAPTGTAIRAALAAATGDVLARRYERTSSPADRDLAFGYLWEAIDAVQPDRGRRIHAARTLSHLAMSCGQPADALRALRTGTELLLTMTWQVADRRSGQHQLARVMSLAADATACALTCGELTTAVELSDAGRGVLWAHALNLRTDLAPVAARDPQLASRLVEIAQALQVPPNEAEEQM